MTIKTECVVKHLKHDYRKIAILVGIAAGAIASIFLGWVAATNAYLVLNPLVAFIAPQCTAINVLNALLAIIALHYTLGIAVCGDKKTFVATIEETSHYDNTKTQRTVEYSNLDIAGEPILLGWFLITIYSMSILFGICKWDFPIISSIVFTVIIAIGSPIGCAIARCKE